MEPGLLLFLAIAAFVLAVVGYQVYQQLAGKSSSLPDDWQQAIAGEPTPEAVRGYQGDFAVQEFQPGYRVTLAYVGQRGFYVRLQRILGGVGCAVLGVGMLYEYRNAAEHPEWPPEAFLFFAALFFGVVVWALWMPKLVQRILVDATVRQVHLERGSGSRRSFPFDAFKRVTLEERTEKRRFGLILFSWRLYLTRRSGIGKLLTESAQKDDRDEAFRSAASLARAISAQMKIPLQVRTTPLVSQRTLRS